MSKRIQLVIASEIGKKEQVSIYSTLTEQQNGLIQRAVKKIGYVGFIQLYPDVFKAFSAARSNQGLAIGNIVIFMRGVTIGE